MPKHPAPKLNPEWVREARDYFKQFLKVTKFPHPVRNGARGSEFDYPEWLVMFIAVLSVKAKVKTYLGIHRLAKEHWDIIAEGLDLKPIPESTLRTRLKKICHSPGKPAVFIFQVFPRESLAHESKRRQDDDKGKGSRVAQKAEGSRHRSKRIARSR
jgi:hypothetical protein